jgi:hypothetical protein
MLLRGSIGGLKRHNATLPYVYAKVLLVALLATLYITLIALENKSPLRARQVIIFII